MKVDKKIKNYFPIVGIGASAGGYEALSAFFSTMPADSGLAFVVVTHQSPDHANLLPELLAKHTSMTVVEASDNIKIKPNTVFLSSPGYNLALVDGVLGLIVSKANRFLSAPVDFFLSFDGSGSAR